MATLTAWAFPGVEDAETASERLQQLQAQELIKIQDAAIVSWPGGKKKPKTKQLSNMTRPGALGGTFWGMLFGLLFFVPLLGAAVGAATGARWRHFDRRRHRRQLHQAVARQVTPGTSALFLLTPMRSPTGSKDASARHPGRAHRQQPLRGAGGQAAGGLRGGVISAASAFSR